MPRAFLSLVFAALASALAACNGQTANPAPGAGPADIGLIEDVMREVEKSYVVPVQPDKLVTGALKGMLGRLDPHSDFLSEHEYRELVATTSGQFGGVGIEISVEDGVPQVVAAIDGTPASAAGVEPGDRIIKADGQPTVGMDIEEVVRRLRGNPGTRVVLTIARASREPFEVPIVRAVIHVESVKSALKANRIGYARVSTFDDNSNAELRAAIGRAKREAGGQLAGFVLDLRNDAGGLLDAAIDVASDFLDKGIVVTTRGRDPDENRIFAAPADGDLVRGVPMVVLINGASASASEIVAGALQDNRRATVMGTRSFGKGSVQSIIPIHGRGALRLTTALYYTPSGASIQGSGITPDVVASLPKDAQVANALMTHESDLFGTLKPSGPLAPTGPRAKPPRPGDDEADRPISPKLIGTPQDTQLNAALEYLRRHPQPPPSERRPQAKR
ncbi:MAG TPA: S41 family peptidase [Stellaceae bacterium]|nr:S41 family peptidase [Stellaceae bacterium]